VVLRNVHRILAIYRLLKCGQLRRLRSYPAGFAANAEGITLRITETILNFKRK
jgi:hypothetical protein